MKSPYKWLQISIAMLLVIQLACEDSVTGLNNDPVEKWNGQLSEEFVHSILKSDGTVWSWGFNYSGTLGNGTTESSDYPVMAQGLNNVISFDQSFGAEVAVDKDGNIWFWGNLWIYSGPPNIDTNVVIPTKLAQLTGVRAITMYGVFIFLLRDDNTVWYIQLDWYTPTIAEGPTLMENNTNIASIWKYIAVTSDGLVLNLFSPNYLQDTLTNIVAVSGNPSRHVVVLKKDGTVWAWGKNNFGQLGNGTLENSEVPTQVLNLTDIISISANFDYNLAIRKDGTVWFWGFEGWEGDSLLAQNVPIKIEQISDAVLICSGYNNLIMTKDNSYWIFNVEDKTPRSVLFN